VFVVAFCFRGRPLFLTPVPSLLDVGDLDVGGLEIAVSELEEGMEGGVLLSLLISIAAALVFPVSWILEVDWCFSGRPLFFGIREPVASVLDMASWGVGASDVASTDVASFDTDCPSCDTGATGTVLGDTGCVTFGTGCIVAFIAATHSFDPNFGGSNASHFKVIISACFNCRHAILRHSKLSLTRGVVSWGICRPAARRTLCAI
jgi:hypothetical protein